MAASFEPCNQSELSCMCKASINPIIKVRINAGPKTLSMFAFFAASGVRPISFIHCLPKTGPYHTKPITNAEIVATKTAIQLMFDKYMIEKIF